MSLLAIPLMGLFVSLVSVFIGLGGGILLVPLLPTVFGLSVHEAVATSLLTIVFVVSDNTLKFHKQRLVHWPVVVLMGPVSAFTAIIAAQVSQLVDADKILWALVILLIIIALRTLFSSFFKADYQVLKEAGRAKKFLSVLGGALAGLTSGFTGVGAGVILSPVMIYLKTVTPAQMAPTANANMVCTTFAASLSFIASGSFVKWNQWGLIRWDIALGVFISASFFSQFLRPRQNKLPFAIKTLLLALLLLVLITKILIQLSS